MGEQAGIATAKDAADHELIVAFGRLLGAANRLEYILGRAIEEEFAKAADGAALTEALVRRYPDNGMLIAAQIGAKVAKGEMAWG